jgi:chromosome segregation ATPase
MTQKQPMTTFEDVEQFAQKMRAWGATVEKRLNGAIDLEQLNAEADELRTKYAAIPQEIRELEQAKATLQANVANLHDEYELIEAQLSIECDGSNKEIRAAQLRTALAENGDAIELKRELADTELSIKMLGIEIEEKERLWSDYHRRVIILAARAGMNIYR